MRLFTRILAALSIVLAVRRNRRNLAKRTSGGDRPPQDLPDVDPVEEASKASFPASDPPQSW